MLCLWFNGWQFEGFEDAKAALIETIVLEMRERRSKFEQVKEAATDVLKRLDYLKLAKMAVKYGGTFFTGVPHPALIQDACSAFKAAAQMIAGNASKEDINKAVEEGSGLLNKAEDGKKIPEEMQEFHKAFKHLLSVAKISRLVVFIDDLDRCLPQTAIETLEAIRLFLFTEKTAFVIGADEQMIEYSVKKHFPDLQKSGLPESYARSYLEKLIQVPFRLPSLGPVETQCYVTLVMAEAILTQNENKEAFKKLCEMAKVNITRPWAAQPIESKQIEEVLKGAVAVPLKEAVSISAQIYTVLSDGTKGNPRLIKRFLNAALLRYAIAAERGIADDIKFPILAKLMLAERFNPIFFDKLVAIASQDPAGKLPVLKHLETPVSERKPSKTSDKETGPKADDLKLLEEWKQDPRINKWARIQPPLSGENLLPYIFITRDRRQSAFGYGIETRFVELIERLCQDEYTISATAQEVKALTTSEASDVAQRLKGITVGSGDFMKKPRGYDGLAFIASHKPEIRPVLLSVFQNLPPGQVGPWAWPEIKTLAEDAALKADASSVIEIWKEQGSSKLKAAIKSLTS